MKDLGEPKPGASPGWVRIFWLGALILVLAFAALHLTGHGVGHHAVMP